MCICPFFPYTTIKEPWLGGQKGYYIPYNLRGNFTPILNITINNYFKDFKIAIPYYFSKPILDRYGGSAVINISKDTDILNPKIKTDSILVSDDNFNVIIKNNLSLDGIRNLDQKN